INLDDAFIHCRHRHMVIYHAHVGRGASWLLWITTQLRPIFHLLCRLHTSVSPSRFNLSCADAHQYHALTHHHLPETTFTQARIIPIKDNLCPHSAYHMMKPEP